MFYFISDLHFGHEKIINFDQRPYSCIDEMNEKLIENWNKTVKNEDTIFVLGDMFYKCNPRVMEYILQKLKGKIILIRGNHDDEKYLEKFKKYFTKIENYIEFSYNDYYFVLSHYPIPLYNKMHSEKSLMIYGHVHNTIEEDYTQMIANFLQQQGIPCKMINVGCMHWDFTPVSIETLILKLDNEKEI